MTTGTQTRRISWAADTDSRGRACDVGTDAQMRRFRVERHGEGRSRWDVTTPDGVTTTVERKSDAVELAESWTPDESLVPLVDEIEDPTPRSWSDWTDDELRAYVVDVALGIDGDEQAPRDNVYAYTSTGKEQQTALKAARGLTRLRKLIDAEIMSQVAGARYNTGTQWSSNAATWSQVGAAVGITKQSASSRFGRND